MGVFVFSSCSGMYLNTDVQAQTGLQGHQSLYSLASTALLLIASAKRKLGTDPGICSFQFVFIIKE